MKNSSLWSCKKSRTLISISAWGFDPGEIDKLLALEDEEQAKRDTTAAPRRRRRDLAISGFLGAHRGAESEPDLIAVLTKKS